MSELDKSIANVACILDSLMALRGIHKIGDCNSCDNKTCGYKPKPGQIVRYNCPFYSADENPTNTKVDTELKDINGNEYKEVTIRVRNPKEDFSTCDHCIHAHDNIAICQSRKCVHAICALYDCFERKEKE